MSTRTNTLVFDFDGTISLGHGPVLAYANGIAEALPTDSATTLLDELATGLAAHPSGRVPGTDAIDGYGYVRELAITHGATEDTLSTAYLASRERLATLDAAISAPDGLAAFLAEARASANLILATNAPATRIPEALELLGLTDAFDEIHTSVGKPAGLDAILDRWLPVGRVLAIGDVWTNDLEPAHRRGASTALVTGTVPDVDGAVAAGASDDDDASERTITPDFAAATLDELYPVILGWLARESR